MKKEKIVGRRSKEMVVGLLLAQKVLQGGKLDRKESVVKRSKRKAVKETSRPAGKLLRLLPRSKPAICRPCALLRSSGNLCRILCQISPPRSGHFFLLLFLLPPFPVSYVTFLQGKIVDIGCFLDGIL